MMECYIYRKRLLQIECVSPKFISWNLIPNRMVFGRGNFVRWLSHKVGALMIRFNALRKEAPERSLIPPSMWGHSKKLQSVNQEAGPHHTPNLQGPWSWIFQLPELWEINFFVYKPPSLWYSVLAVRTD